MKKILTILAMIGGLAVGKAAVTYNIVGENITGENTGENNLYLGFYSASEVSTKSVLINLGTSADVRNGLSLNLSANAALSGTFGADWFNNSQVYWSVIGYDGGYAQYGSFYVARPSIQPLLQTDVLGSTALTDDQYWGLSDKVGALTVAHNTGAAVLSSVIGSAGNTHQISVVDNAPATFSGMADANFSTFTSAVYEQVIGGLSIQQFTFNGVNSFPTVDGAFAGISQLNGVVNVVPEPSTYALLGLGGVLLFTAYRRKAA
jgi:hypothetical protein